MKRGYLKRGAWRREQSETWKALDELPISKGINERVGHDEAKKLAEFARKYHSLERVLIVKAMPCVACGAVPSDNAHGSGGGVAHKAGWETIIPLCRVCHRSQHDTGVSRFEREVLTVVGRGLTWDEHARVTDEFCARWLGEVWLCDSCDGEGGRTVRTLDRSWSSPAEYAVEPCPTCEGGGLMVGDRLPFLEVLREEER